jgi:chemotaxis protein MotA
MNARRNTMATTILGCIGVIALVAYIVFAGTIDSGAFVNGPALMIVFGGLLVALLMSFRTSEVARAWHSVRAVFHEEASLDGEIDALVAFAGARQKADVQGADKIAESVRDPFLRLGLQLVLEDASPADIQHVLTWRIQKVMEKEGAQARIFRTLSDFAPALGLVGTIVGLMGMLGGLGTQPLSATGQQMALALTTTLYGVLVANLVFRPMAIKLEQRTLLRVQKLNVLVEGIVLVRLGRGPVRLRDAMRSFVAEYEDEFVG